MKRTRGTCLLLSLVFIPGLLVLAVTACAGNATWVQTAAGTYDWDNTANWNPAAFPDGVGSVATVSVVNTGPQTINLNQAVTIGTLVFGGKNGTANTMQLVTGTAGSLTFSGGGAAQLIIPYQSLYTAQADGISAPVVLADDLDIVYAYVGTSRSLRFGDIGESGGARKLSLATMSFYFSGSNSYSGRTLLTRAVLYLDYVSNTNNKLSATDTLVMSNSVLNVTGSAVVAISQPISGLVLGEGLSQLTVSAGANKNFALALGAISRSGQGAAYLTTVNNGSGVASFQTTSANNNGILNGFITTGSDWVMNNGSDTIAAFSGYQVNTFNNNDNTQVTANQSPAANVAINSLKLSGGDVTFSGANNVIASGGILVSSGTRTISGGTLTSGNGRDLVLNLNGGNLVLNSAVADNGATPIGLTMGGSGNSVTLGGASTFSGDIVCGRVLGGVTITCEGALGTTGTLYITRPSDAGPTFQTTASAVFSNSILWKTSAFNNNYISINRANNVTICGQVGYATGTGGNMMFLGVAGSCLTLLGNNTNLPGSGAPGSLGAIRVGHSNAFGFANISLTTTGYVQRVYVLDNVNYARNVTINSITNVDGSGLPQISAWLGMDAPGTGTFSGTITLGSAATPSLERSVVFYATNGASCTFSGVVQAGSARVLPVFKDGAGTVVFTAANTYPGPTTISNGVLLITGSGKLGNGEYTAAISNEATLVIGTTAAQTLSGVISGAGSLVKTNSGTLTLSGANTYAGSTSVSNGLLVIGHSGLLGGGDYAAAITNNGTLVIGSAQAQTLSGPISGSGALIKTNSSTLTLSGTNTMTGVVSVGGGTLRLADTNSISTNAVLYVYTGGTNELAFAGTREVTGLFIDGVAQVTGTWGSSASSATHKDDVHFKGPGMLGVVSMLETYDGAWAVDAGGNWSEVANWSGSVAFGAGRTAWFTNAITAARTIVNDFFACSIGNITFGPNSYGWQIVNGTIMMTNSSTPVITVNTCTAIVSSAISGTQGFVKQGSGALVLSSSNSYSGGTTVSNGNVGVGNANSLGTGMLTWSAPTGSVFSNTTTLIVAGGITNAINLVSNMTVNTAGGSLMLSGAITNTGSLTLAQGNGVTNYLVTSNSYSGGTIITNGNANSWVEVQNGNAFGSGLVTGSTHGKLLFNFATAATVPNNITLNPGTDNYMRNIGSGRVTLAGRLGGGGSTYTPFVGTGTDGGFLLLGNNSLGLRPYVDNTTVWVGHNNAFVTSSGRIAFGTGNHDGRVYLLNGITFGTPIWDFNLGVSYTGLAFTVGSDQPGATCMFSGAINLRYFINPPDINHWFFEAAEGAVVTFGNVIYQGSNTNLTDQTILNPVNKIGAGTVVYAAANTYGGVTTISNGTLQVGNGGAAGTLGTGNVVNLSRLVFSRSDAVYTNAVCISGTGTVIKAGTGTVTFSGTNIYTGETVVENGILNIVGSGTLEASTSVTVQAGAKLVIQNTGNALNDKAGVHLATGSSLYLTGGVSEVVSALYIDGHAAASGTWGTVDCQWTNTALFAGSGLLVVTNIPFSFQAARGGSDITIQAAGCSTGSVYRVLGFNGNLTNTALVLCQVSNITAFTYIDTNALGSVDRRFYRLTEDDQAGTVVTNEWTYTAFRKQLAADCWHKYALGLDFGVSNTLASTLGAQLAQELNSNNASASADMLYLLSTQGNWQICYVNGSGQWCDYPSGVVTNTTVQSWQSFWLKRRNIGGTIAPVYSGYCCTGGVTVTFKSNDWHMITWPLAADRREGDGTEKGWGFAAAGAQKGTGWLNSDLLTVGDGAAMRFYYLNSTGRWCAVGQATPASAVSLHVGESYYYLHRGTGMLWTARQ